MTIKMWHIILLILVGYAIGYWMPSIGDSTLGKLYARS